MNAEELFAIANITCPEYESSAKSLGFDAVEIDYALDLVEKDIIALKKYREQKRIAQIVGTEEKEI